MGAGSRSTLTTSRRALGGWAALCLAAPSLGASSGADDARGWLARTDEALARRNYEGVFVHEHSGESETLRVIHRVGRSGVAERLQSMDGSGREFIRRGNQLTCYLPDQHTVLVEQSPEGALLLSGLPRMDAGSGAQYQFREVRETRVSGRDAHVIAIEPLDQMRYGYRVWIDTSTAMPLKTQLRDSHGNVLEQIVFTSLNMLTHIPRAELEPAVDAHAYRWVRRDAETEDSGALSVSWESAALPPGFRMTASARQMLPAGPVEHLVFSDGLASVSVFVERGQGHKAPGGVRVETEDAAAIGASSAYSSLVEGYRITAVGEVPPETVRLIAQAIRHAEPAITPATAGGAGAEVAASPAAAPVRPTTEVFDPGPRDGFEASPTPATLTAPGMPALHGLDADAPAFGSTAGSAFGADLGHR